MIIIIIIIIPDNDVPWQWCWLLSLESQFKYNKENEYVFWKKDTPESFILLLFIKKVSTVIYTEGGQTLSRW